MSNLSFGEPMTTHNGIDYPINQRKPVRTPVTLTCPLPLKMLKECPRAKMARYNHAMGTRHPLPRQNAETWRETLGAKRSAKR